jgi:hypothetical protein
LSRLLILFHRRTATIEPTIIELTVELEMQT